MYTQEDITKKANQLIEVFYQKAPEVMGSGRALEFGTEMAKSMVDEFLRDLPPTLLPDRYSFWKAVYNELENN